jgi:cytochrome c-type biogenesis protein CcmE
MNGLLPSRLTSKALNLMLPSQKMLLGAILVAGAIGYLAYAGAANSWQYYLSVDEAVNDAALLVGKRVRVSGRVRAGTLSIAEDRRRANFDLQGEKHMLSVACYCSLPDNLAENIDVVVEGTFDAGRISARKVITRCASKYDSKRSSESRE